VVRTSSAWLALWGALLLASPALAQEQSPTELMRDAATHVSAGRFADGIADFERLFDKKPRPRVLLNIARAYHDWGDHCAESLTTLGRFFKLCAECSARADGDALKALVRQRCVASVPVQTVPPGAALAVDGAAAGTSPATIDLLLGARSLTATLAGYRVATREVVAQADMAPITLHLQAEDHAQLAPRVAPPPPEPAPVLGTHNPLVPAYIALGLGGVGLIVGAVAGGSYFTTVSDRDAELAKAPPSKSRVDALEEDAVSQALVAQIGLVLGLGGLIAGTTLWVLNDETPATAGVRPLFGPGSVGLGGRF
jgi:hypothetical protein